MEVIGYLHVLIQTLTIDGAKTPIHANISLGEIAKVDTSSKPSGSTFNEVFLIEVPKNPSRLAIFGFEGDQKIGECRYDVNPFFEHQCSTHTIESDLFNDENKKVGSVKLKITYYSAKYGKLKVRIFGLEFPKALLDQFKQAKIKVRFGIHAQSTPMLQLDKPVDETVVVLVLNPSMNLTFDVVHEQGVLATYTIPNAKEGGMLNEEPKAFQVSLFNKQTAVGLIKYQLDWLKPKPEIKSK